MTDKPVTEASHAKKQKPISIPLYKADFRSMINLYPCDKTAYSKDSAAARAADLLRGVRPDIPFVMDPWHPPPPLTDERLLEMSLLIRASVKYIDLSPYPTLVKGIPMTHGEEILRFEPYKH